MLRILIMTAVMVLIVPTVTRAEGLFEFVFEELAPGVWAGVRPDGPRFPVMGNVTFVVSEEGVVVYDGGGMPAMSEQVINKIRSITDEPVTHVITSHWHGDHNFGVYRFAEEFPNVQFIAHEFTREVMNSARINYVDRERGFVEANLENFQKIIETGIDLEGNEHSEVDRASYRDIVEHRDEIDREFLRAKVTPPNVVFAEKYAIKSGRRIIELLHLGHANTAGDIVMWLPDEKIVATGDIVVLPSPYAFNVPPKPWAQTLRNINALGYKVLVPGHGDIQKDKVYVDLLIEAAESIANQRDAMLAEGKTQEEVRELLDFSAFEERFTFGDETVRTYYKAYFEQPFRAAAIKALTGKPMVQLPLPVSVPFDDERWVIEAVESEIGVYLGQTALRIKGGSALLPDTDIKNGLVEFDVAVTPQRGFAGFVFRQQDPGNYENFYIRPHQSGNPDANQYQPVFNNSASWQLYHGEGFGAPVQYRYNEWMHVRILFAESQARIFIDSETPVLNVTDLKREISSGAIGVSSSNFSTVHFANFKYTKLANAYANPQATVVSPKIDGLIKTWQVSDVFEEALLSSGMRLEKNLQRSRVWKELPAEASGITNLAELAGTENSGNTVFARHIVSAKRATNKMLTFGYSDRARVYLNGVLLYRGNNNYRSRDYRYLGTVGLFDSVVLPLKKGKNELWIAVSEDFGGWGVIGQITEQ